jgi:large conductance mechanosensitive channel
VKLVKEFKEFAMRGNVVDLAVGIIIGAAFGKIVSSLVNDVIMPPLGLLIGGVDFAKLGIKFKSATETSEAVVLRYGVFINTLVDFIIVAFAIFMVIKGLNSMKRKPEVQAPPALPAPSKQEVLLEEIRDILKKK